MLSGCQHLILQWWYNWPCQRHWYHQKYGATKKSHCYPKMGDVDKLLTKISNSGLTDSRGIESFNLRFRKLEILVEKTSCCLRVKMLVARKIDSSYTDTYLVHFVKSFRESRIRDNIQTRKKIMFLKLSCFVFTGIFLNLDIVP